MHMERAEYFRDIWNYLELIAIFIFFWASSLDIYNNTVTDTMRILFSLSTMLSLVKIVYLVRVFRQLNFLVTMMMTVVSEVVNFMVLFFIFLMTFAQCNHILEVDHSSYGRMTPIVAHFYMVLRSAMGDFSLIDPY